jgi:hypothetical protein
VLEREKIGTKREGNLDRVQMSVILWPAHAVARRFRAVFEMPDNGLQ